MYYLQGAARKVMRDGLDDCGLNPSILLILLLLNELFNAFLLRKKLSCCKNLCQRMYDCLGCVVSQLTWSNTLSEVLTNQGVPENTTVGMYITVIALNLRRCGNQRLACFKTRR